MTQDGPKMVHFGPKKAKHGRLVNAQKGPKGAKMVNLSIVNHLGSLLGTSGPFWVISDKNDFWPQMDKRRV